jgi:hypothetical protein
MTHIIIIVTNSGRTRRTSVLIIFCALIGVFAAAGCSEFFASSSDSGCTGREERLAGHLDDLAVLELRPAGATLQGRNTGCYDSSDTVYAERIYRRASTVDEVIKFYRRVLPAVGWKLEHVRSSRTEPGTSLNASRICFSGTVEGTTASLGVRFQGDFDKDAAGDLGRDPRDFGLVVYATPDARSWWCG